MQKTIDCSIFVYESVGEADDLGWDSKFTEVPHPGTSNKIEGWYWNKAIWPLDIEEEIEEND